jgi:hypothetical protein
MGLIPQFVCVRKVAPLILETAGGRPRDNICRHDLGSLLALRVFVTLNDDRARRPWHLMEDVWTSFMIAEDLLGQEQRIGKMSILGLSRFTATLRLRKELLPCRGICPGAEHKAPCAPKGRF